MVASIPMSQEQVRSLLKYIDATQSEAVKQELFSRLGHECFYSTAAVSWIKGFNGDVQAFLDRVNVEHASPFWESLVFNEERTALILTGKEVTGCVCAFADGQETPRALCDFCCKHFQEVMFGALLERPVEVTITASYLRGDTHCDTEIRFAEPLPAYPAR